MIDLLSCENVAEIPASNNRFTVPTVPIMDYSHVRKPLRCNTIKAPRHLSHQARGMEATSIEGSLMTQRICEVEGCTKPYRSKGLCTGHYQRNAKEGSPGGAELRVTGQLAHCTIGTCKKPVAGNGMCSTHYYRLKRTGDVGASATDRHIRGACAFEDCDRPHSAKGYCNTHYWQQKRRGVVEVINDRLDPLTRDDMGRKRCTSCKQWQELTAFKVDIRQPDHVRSTCTTCHRDRLALARYGIGVGRYDELHAAQGGGCAICGGLNPSGRMLAIDHDHACCSGDRACGNCVRGLLCSRCNTGIGQFLEDITRLESAIAYLKETGRG